MILAWTARWCNTEGSFANLRFSLDNDILLSGVGERADITVMEV